MKRLRRKLYTSQFHDNPRIAAYLQLRDLFPYWSAKRAFEYMISNMGRRVL